MLKALSESIKKKHANKQMYEKPSTQDSHNLICHQHLHVLPLVAERIEKENKDPGNYS